MRKNNISIKLPDGSDANAQRDNDSFRKEYNSWEAKADGLSGSDIGHLKETGISLFTMVKQQGVSGRVMENSGPRSRNKGGVVVYAFIRKLFNSREYSHTEFELLEKLDIIMDGYSKSDSLNNPANIYFSDPTDWTEKGAVTDRVDVYGHYRTENYEDNRNTKRRYYDDIKDSPAVDTSWYSGSMGEAKPPFWQALYGDGSDSPFSHTSLHTIIKNAIASFDDLELEISKNTPVRIERTGAWKLGLQLDTIKDIVTTFVNKGPNRGGNFMSAACVNAIMKDPIDIEGNKESEVVKNLMGLKGVDQNITEIWVKISRRQCNRMAHFIAGDKVKWKKKAGDVLQFVSEVKPPMKKKKASDDVNKSWMEMMKV